MIRYNLIFVLGGPGSGKGTLCSNLVKRFDSFVHVSPGDLIRSKQDLDLETVATIENGKLLPTPYIGSLIWSHIKKNIETDKIILLDGFPRNKENMEYYNLHMQNNFNLLATIVLNCEDDLMIERIATRAKTLDRIDDNEKTCKTRIQTYHEETEKVLGLIDKNLIKNIYSTKSEDETYAQAFKILIETLPF